MNVKERANAVKVILPAIFIALQRKDTPIASKVAAALTVGYALSPIDIIPDFIPVLGYLDDIIILPVLAGLTIKLIPPDIMTACRMEAQSLWQEGRPKRWFYAIPIVALWAIMIIIILEKIMGLIN